MSNEEEIEEILMEAHRLGCASEVLERGKKLIDKGSRRTIAYLKALNEIKKEKDEIHRRGH
jgi:hypothetical protein